MCKIGDIILIDTYASHGVNLSQHSFVVLNDENGKICGMDYNLMCVVMSSFHSEEHKAKKLKYPGNFPVTPQDSSVINGNNKEGYIKADQIYFFDKSQIDFKVIGNLHEEVLRCLISLIETLEELEQIVDNLRSFT